MEKKTAPIYHLDIAKKLLRKGYRIHDISLNNNGSGNLVFFFIQENGLKEVLKDEFNISIR